jgi:type I restriction enzyme S subunit
MTSTRKPPSDTALVDLLPASWPRIKAKFLFRERKCLSMDGSEELLSASHLTGITKRSEKDVGMFLAETNEGYKIVNTHDVVVNTMWAWMGAMGVSFIDGIISPSYGVYCPITEKTYPKYFDYLLRSTPFVTDVNRRSKGVWSSRLRLYPDDFLGMLLPLPDISRQKEITDFLDQETTRIDQLIEKKWSLIETLPLRAEALIDKALSASDTRWLRFGHAAKMVFRAVNRQDNEPYIAIGLYNRGRGIFHKEETYGQDLGDSTFSWVKPNDLIFSGQFAWEGAVALASEREDNKIASHRYPIYNARDGIESAYLFSYFRTHRGKFLMNDCSRGAAGRNRPLNTNRLEKEQIPIPSSSLQKQVAALVQQEDILKVKITESIQALNIYKVSLVTEAVTGQLDIHAWQKHGTGDRQLDQIEHTISEGAQAAC